MRKLTALLLAAFQLAAQRPPDPAPTFKASANFVILSVFVRDSKGEPLAGLNKDDFTVLENGKPQTISVFEYQKLSNELLPPLTPSLQTRPVEMPETAPERYQDRRLLVLFFDFAGMPPVDQIRTQQSALEFINKSLTASDLVSIMSFNSKLRTDVEFTSDRDKLIAAIKRFRIGVGDEFLTGIVPEADLEATNTEPETSDVETEFDLFNTDRKLAALESAAKHLKPEAGAPESSPVEHRRDNATASTSSRTPCTRSRPIRAAKRCSTATIWFKASRRPSAIFRAITLSATTAATRRAMAVSARFG